MSRSPNTFSLIDWLLHLLDDERRFWILSAVLLGITSWLKGIRSPNLWAATQAELDYSQGFIKRGFFGATVTRLLHLYRYEYFAAFSFLSFLVMAVLLVLLVRSSRICFTLGKAEIVALFFSSYTVTFLAHLIGYLDVLLITILLGLLLVESDDARWILAAPAVIMAVLIHESFLLLFLPVLLLSFAPAFYRSQDSSLRKRTIFYTASLLSVTLATTLIVSFHSSLSTRQIQALQQRIAMKVDFPLRTDLFDVLAKSFSDNLHGEIRIAASDEYELRFLASAVVFFPVLLLILRAGTFTIGASNIEGKRILRKWAILASISPLSMHFIAWDCERWDALACLDSFLVVLILCRSIRKDEKINTLSRRWTHCAILTMALSMACGECLMDGLHSNLYPFSQLATDAFRQIAKGQLVIPSQ